MTDLCFSHAYYQVGEGILFNLLGLVNVLNHPIAAKNSGSVPFTSVILDVNTAVEEVQYCREI